MFHFYLLVQCMGENVDNKVVLHISQNIIIQELVYLDGNLLDKPGIELWHNLFIH